MSALDATFVPGNDDWMPHPDLHAEAGMGHPDFVVSLPFVRFDPETGEITSRGSMALAHIMRERLIGGGILVGEGHWTTHYVDLSDGVPVMREKAACTAVRDGMVLRSLPVPCRIEISTPFAAPTVYAWGDPALTLSFEHPGSYTVRVLAVPYLPGVFDVRFDG